ncbi:MAG: hypothetical protein WBX11_08345 [Thiobacillaceae bacterium]
MILFLGLTALIQSPLRATCFTEQATGTPSGVASPSTQGSAPVPPNGGLPGIPVLVGPVNGTVLDGGSANTGTVVMPPDENGMSVRAPLELSWTAAEPAATGRDATMIPVPDTTHYRICVFETDKEALCDSTAIPLNEKGIVRYVKTCDQSDALSIPGGGLVGFQPSTRSTVTELYWKTQACNSKRFRCSGWSEKGSLKWLPAPVISSPPDRRIFTSRGPDGLGARLVVKAVANVEGYRFCIARPGDQCPETVTYRQPDNPNPVPLVREPQGNGPDMALLPQVEIGQDGTAIPLQSWFDGQTVNWTAAACLTLPNTESIADESRRMGCVYQEPYRTITFAP